jgi:hypothetical protein
MKQTPDNTSEPRTLLAVAAGSARHTCARIRRGLYNYRAYNIRHYSLGWAVRGEDEKPYSVFMKTLRGCCQLIDEWERRPNNLDQTRGGQRPA